MTDSNEGVVNERLLQPTTSRLFVIVMGACLIYAGLRYHVAEGVPLAQAPLYVLNKAISLGGLAFLAMSYLVGKVAGLRWGDRQLELVVIKFCGLIGFSLIVGHVLMSLALLDPAYYAKFYGEAKFNLIGELSLSLGIFGLWCFSMPVITSLPYMYDELGADRWLRSQRVGYAGLMLSAGHVLVMGLQGWLNPGDWPAAMPPITVLAFVIAMVPLVLRLVKNRNGA
jgi:DMSO/TMAO reductase YedYZ heme-binding membrane subunit